MSIMSEKSLKPVEPEDWKDDDIIKCKIALKRDYIAQSNSQAVRLLGLIAGLFTLLQVVQNSKNLHVSDIFSINIPNITILESLANLFPWKLLVFVFSVGFLLFFIFRAFFRYAVFSAYLSHVRWIEKPELHYLLKIKEDLKGKNLLVLLEFATEKKISGAMKDFEKNYTRQKLYKWICYDWFISENEKWGYLLCLGLSLLSTWILLGLIW